MAELLLLVFVAVVVAAAYFIGRQFDSFRATALVWIVAGALLAAGLFVYGKSKVDTARSGFLAPYQRIQNGEFD